MNVKGKKLGRLFFLESFVYSFRSSCFESIVNHRLFEINDYALRVSMTSSPCLHSSITVKYPFKSNLHHFVNHIYSFKDKKKEHFMSESRERERYKISYMWR